MQKYALKAIYRMFTMRNMEFYRDEQNDILALAKGNERTLYVGKALALKADLCERADNMLFGGIVDYPNAASFKDKETATECQSVFLQLAGMSDCRIFIDERDDIRIYNNQKNIEFGDLKFECEGETFTFPFNPRWFNFFADDFYSNLETQKLISKASKRA